MIVLSVVVGLFGVASAVLGFIAEATKLTVSAIYTTINFQFHPSYETSSFFPLMKDVPFAKKKNETSSFVGSDG